MMMSIKIVRIVLAVAIVANVVIGFVPSKSLFASRVVSSPVTTTTTSNSFQRPLAEHHQQFWKPQQQKTRRRRQCRERYGQKVISGLCVSQQQNEFMETTPTNNSSIDSSIPELNGGTAASAGSGGLAQVVLKDHDHYYETAIRRTIGWVAAAIGFGISLGFVAESETSEEFFAGYLLEQSLSIDNLLVFLLLFEYFKIPLEHQNRVLNWGIIGAIIMRAVMIGAGAVAIQKFHAVLLVFAAILIFSSGKVILGNDDDEEEDLSENQIVKFSNNLISSTDQFDGDRFFTDVNGIKTATPMLLCMVAVEVSDVIFAVDSIPAVFGVTENPLVVFTSNMFAIMGLRSLYTILSKAASELKYLEKAVAVVLGFIGGKMIAEYFGVEIPTEFSVGIVITMLGTGVLASILDNNEENEEG